MRLCSAVIGYGSGDAGSELWEFSNRFLRAMKLLALPKSKLKDALVGKLWVIRVTGFRQKSLDEWTIARAKKADPALDLSVDERSEVWYHVSNMCLSPYAPFMREMKVMKTEQDETYLEVGYVTCLLA